MQFLSIKSASVAISTGAMRYYFNSIFQVIA